MKKLFRDASIQMKLIGSHFLLIAIPTVLIILLFYSSLNDLIVNDSIRQAFALSRQSAAALDAELGPIRSVASAIRSNTFIRQLCTDSISDEDKEELVFNHAFLNDLNTQLTEDKQGTLITSIHIYTDHVPEGLYDNWILGDFFLPEANSAGTYWHGIMSATEKTELYCPSFYLSHSEIDRFGPLAYIMRLYPSSAPSASPSYLAVYFSSEDLEEILRRDVALSGGVAYIINDRQSLVASSDPGLAAAYLMDYDTIRLVAHTENGFSTRRVLGEEIYTAAYPLADMDWYMTSVLPSKPILERGRRLVWNFAMIYLLTLGVGFLISWHLARSITRRLSAINIKMKEARSKPPVRVPDPLIHDEIGELTDSYNHMAERQNLLMKTQQETAEELRVTEIRALQAQINPHFLYNTMEMINWLSQSGEQQEVTRAIQALSSFYKLTLGKKDLFTDIGSELRHVELYVELQNMRYENKITLVSDIPDELMHLSLPRLTLQPIVENAILHGILEKESQSGNIVIAGWINEKEGEEEGIRERDAVLLVSDDGVGMDQETLKLILSGENKAAKGTNIAVSNTHRRLQMLYGPSYGLAYRSRKGDGTEVEIRIPFRD